MRCFNVEPLPFSTSMPVVLSNTPAKVRLDAVLACPFPVTVEVEVQDPSSQVLAASVQRLFERSFATQTVRRFVGGRAWTLTLLPLLFAPLVPYQTVGVLLASILAVSGGATLLLLPAIFTVAERFLFRNRSRDAAGEK